MATTYRTKLFRSVIDRGCSMSLGEFAHEAQFEDIEEWLKERGYGIVPCSYLRRSPLWRTTPYTTPRD